MKIPLWFRIVYSSERKSYRLFNEVKRLNKIIQNLTLENNDLKTNLEIYKKINFDKDSI